MHKTNYNIVRHFYFTLVLVVFILSPLTLHAQDKILETPDTIEGVQESITGVGDTIFTGLIQAVESIWEKQVVPVWQSMWQWTINEAWETRAEPALRGIIDQGKVLIGQEVEQRKPIIKEQLEEEKQEIRQGLQDQGKQAGKSLWERFKALFRQ